MQTILKAKAKQHLAARTLPLRLLVLKPQSDLESTQLTFLSRFLSCPLIIKVILGTFPQIMGFTDTEL